MPAGFLDLLKGAGMDRIEQPDPSAPEPVHDDAKRSWDFAFATGIECSNPTIVDPAGKRIRRDELAETGHYERFREDLQLVKELGTPVLRYGLPNHLIHLGPDKFD